MGRSNTLEKEKGRKKGEGGKRLRKERKQDRWDKRGGRERKRQGCRHLTEMNNSGSPGKLNPKCEGSAWWPVQQQRLNPCISESLCCPGSCLCPLSHPRGLPISCTWVWWAESLLSPENQTKHQSPKQSKPDKTTPNLLGRHGGEEEGFVVLF